jgi:hypothetical protein
MHKYAAVTALAIALITMLVLAVSVSLTPANARGWYCDNEVCVCHRKCEKYRDNSQPFGRPLASEFVACIASCGRTEGVEHLSPSELRARVKAKEAAQRRRPMPWANDKN